MGTVVLCAPELGLTELMLEAGASLTVKMFAPDAVSRPVVIVKLRGPGVAPAAMFKVALKVVALRIETLLTVIPAPGLRVETPLVKVL